MTCIEGRELAESGRKLINGFSLSWLKKKKKKIHLYLWLIHVDVWQRPIQYCKVIICQEKKEKMVVQWLILCASNAEECVGLFPGQSTEIPYATGTAQKKKKCLSGQ